MEVSRDFIWELCERMGLCGNWNFSKDCVMKYANVTSPQFANEDGTQINCFVEFEGFDAPLPFTADARDIAEHGKQIFSELMLGKWGEISAYISPSTK